MSRKDLEKELKRRKISYSVRKEDFVQRLQQHKDGGGTDWTSKEMKQLHEHLKHWGLRTSVTNIDLVRRLQLNDSERQQSVVTPEEEVMPEERSVKCC
ncbi:hypothetical protein HKX48_007865 [Thoreauomyces humboldtii]|nr:hypothetical protein HKX48_007865 [Thoreauomyces humboldtii]